MADWTADSAQPPPAGSLRWFAWLFAAPTARPLLAFAFALELQLHATTEARIDHQVSHLKLQWWREEIGRLEQGQPRHPLTQAACSAAPAAGSRWRPIQDLLSSLELDLASTSIASEAELDRYLALADGLQRMIAAVLVPLDARAERFASATGGAVRIIEMIRDLRKDAMRGRIYLPRDWLDAEGIDYRALASEAVGPGARRCLARLAEKAREQGRRATVELQDCGAADLRAQNVLLGLHLELLDRIERGQFEAGCLQVELSHMRSLWTAWRVARQH